MVLTQDQMLAITLLVGNFLKQTLSEIGRMSPEEVTAVIAEETQRKAQLMKILDGE